MKGNVPWNKGLTKETDERVKKYCDKRDKTFKEKGYLHSKKTLENWSKERKGMESPMKGKRHKLSSRIKNSLSHSGDEDFVVFKNSFIRRLRANNLYLKWRANIFKRDNYTCQNCFERDCYLEAHHIVPFGKMISAFRINSIDKAIKCKALWDEGNGITYCRECHIMLDKNIGVGLQQTRSNL